MYKEIKCIVLSPWLNEITSTFNGPFIRFNISLSSITNEYSIAKIGFTYNQLMNIFLVSNVLMRKRKRSEYNFRDKINTIQVSLYSSR